MIRWKGPGVLTSRKRLYRPGDAIPSGLLTIDRIKALGNKLEVVEKKKAFKKKKKVADENSEG